jgi:hypothetical protein
VTHEPLCTCSACHKLDKRHPLEGHQLAMFDQRTQHIPTDAEALRDLFRLAGKDAAYDHSGQRGLIL